MTTALAFVAGLPDLDRLRELIERVKQILVTGGIGLALAGSLIFLLAWVLSYLRRPAVTAEKTRVLPIAALLVAWAPALLTLVAGLGALVPTLAPFVLKSFALAVILAGFAWCLAVAAVVAGGSKKQLARARKALLLSGTPWYCLAVYLSTFL
ncbi:MAG: hypothetical protein AAF721_39490 [Myxococcota bacterium]